MSDEMVALLKAELDEDEAAAKAVRADQDYADSEHQERWNPARVLREVEAKRAIITITLRCAEAIDGEWGCGHSADEIAAGQCEYLERDEDGILGILRQLATISTAS